MRNFQPRIFVSLFVLLTLRTLGTIATRAAPATLGMTGRCRTAATEAMLTVFLDIALFFRLWGAFGTPRGLP